jgi:hypothetical protein
VNGLLTRAVRPPCLEKTGCREAALDRSPWCERHARLHRYAARVSAELEERDRELELVRRHGHVAVAVRGSRARELCDLLEAWGPKTPSALAALAGDLELPIAASYLVALERGGVVVPRGLCVDLSPVERVRREAAYARAAG